MGMFQLQKWLISTLRANSSVSRGYWRVLNTRREISATGQITSCPFCEFVRRELVERELSAEDSLMYRTHLKREHDMTIWSDVSTFSNCPHQVSQSFIPRLNLLLCVEQTTNPFLFFRILVLDAWNARSYVDFFVHSFGGLNLWLFLDH